MIRNCENWWYQCVDLSRHWSILSLCNSDQLPVSTKFDMRSDPGVVRNYGRLLLEMVTAVPDGIVCFFVSYSYMDGIVNSWNEMGILQVCITVSDPPPFAGLRMFSIIHSLWNIPKLVVITSGILHISLFNLQDVMQHKLVFIETQDVVETTLALDNYRRACDCGRGAVFFSVARYWVLLSTHGSIVFF